MTKEISINIPVLARVEGEGALALTIKDKRITDLKLNIYEPPRFFEKLLEGRPYPDLIDIVARICGICPVAYQMSAVSALEQIAGIQSTAWINNMRRVMYCGEWIQSHSLHIHMLAAPDYLGFDSILGMAKQYPDQVKRGLFIQQVGNHLIELFGGRSVHPIGVKVGGFYRAPSAQEVARMLEELKDAEMMARELVIWVSQMDFPSIERSMIFVSLKGKDNYPLMGDTLVSSSGDTIKIEDFQQYFTESQVPHSTALHSFYKGKPYLVGPLARINNNHHLFPEKILSLVQKLPIRFPSHNMFHSMLARAIEIYFAILEAQHLLENYQEKESAAEGSEKMRSGVGFGCSEAPRGILWHRYEIDNKNTIVSANIIPPTSQNQACMEEDLRFSIENFALEKSDDEIKLFGEKIIRNYDPCISCATHFLDLTLARV